MTSPDAADALLGAVVARLSRQAVVVDALGSACLTGDLSRLHHLDSSAVLTLNPTETALTLGRDEQEVAGRPVAATLLLAKQARTVVVLGGSTKYVGDPDGRSWLVDTGGPGLGVSGSGDVQAGIVTGLLARGAEARAGGRVGRLVARPRRGGAGGPDRARRLPGPRAAGDRAGVAGRGRPSGRGLNPHWVKFRSAAARQEPGQARQPPSPGSPGARSAPAQESCATTR
jgi:hypothetical protein